MTKKKYSSFEDINADLKILALEQEVCKETLKLNYQNVKNSLYPTHMLGGLTGIFKKIALSLAAKKVLKKFS